MNEFTFIGKNCYCSFTRSVLKMDITNSKEYDVILDVR